MLVSSSIVVSNARHEQRRRARSVHYSSSPLGACLRQVNWGRSLNLSKGGCLPDAGRFPSFGMTRQLLLNEGKQPDLSLRSRSKLRNTQPLSSNLFRQRLSPRPIVIPNVVRNLLFQHRATEEQRGTEINDSV